MKYKYKISVIIPTLNSEKYLDLSLKSIFNQKNIDKFDVIIVDAFSKDKTRQIAKKFPVRIIDNNLVTGEAGKMLGLKESNYEIVAFIDSDNVISDKRYFEKAINILNKHQDLDIDCIEPIGFKFLKKDSAINQYCSLMGLNDPIEFYLGRFDKNNIIINDYTIFPKENLINNSKYLIDRLSFVNKLFPTFGANGTIYKKNKLKKIFNFNKSKYFFDVDVTLKIFVKNKKFTICKIRSDIIHFYCEDIFRFLKKQTRRVEHFLYFTKIKKIRVEDKKYLPIDVVIIIFLKFLFVFPILVDSINLAIKSKFKIKFLSHFFYSYLTTLIYFLIFLKYFINNNHKIFNYK